jgi:hypothetical protein
LDVKTDFTSISDAKSASYRASDAGDDLIDFGLALTDFAVRGLQNEVAVGREAQGPGVFIVQTNPGKIAAGSDDEIVFYGLISAMKEKVDSGPNGRIAHVSIVRDGAAPRVWIVADEVVADARDAILRCDGRLSAGAGEKPWRLPDWRGRGSYRSGSDRESGWKYEPGIERRARMVPRWARILKAKKMGLLVA